MESDGMLRKIGRSLASLAGAGLLTLSLFLVLPVMQTIGDPLGPDLSLRSVDVANLPPPPPPEIEEPEPEEEPPEPKPELTETAEPLDLSQLELALNPTFGDGAFGDFTVNLPGALADQAGDDVTAVFSMADLDQRPRVLFQRMPRYPPELRRKNRSGTVHVVFQVNEQGRVINPVVEKSTDPAFEAPALEAVKQWKFEPGTRQGQTVQFKMRVPITFNPS